MEGTCCAQGKAEPAAMHAVLGCAPTRRTARPSAASILGWYDDDIAAEYAARGWYTLARKAARSIARDHGTTLRVAAGIIAAMSPMSEWSGNITASRRLAAAHAAGDRTAPAAGLRQNVDKAWRILSGERPLDVLNGPKVRAFYRNILGDLSAVTVDRWAARAAGVPDSFVGTRARYDEVADEYRKAAALVELEPAILQAVVWCKIRGKAV
jgi:hypothetical protein